MTACREPLATDREREPGSAPDAPGRDVVAPIPDDFRCEHGDRLADEVVRARLAGPEGAPVVAVMGGISADRFVADEPALAELNEAGQSSTRHRGWWSDMVRPGGGLDLERYRVLGIDFAPQTAEAPITITPYDQARLLALAMDAGGVARLHAIVGASYGGMVGLAFARAFPERIERLVVISAAHRPHPMATAWRGVQRRIMAFAAAAGRPDEGVALARELAMTTYRTPEEFAVRFKPGIEGAGEDGEVCGYLKSRGRAYASIMTPARFASLSAAIDRHAEDPRAITTPTLLIGAASDRLVPLEDMKALAEELAGPSRLVALDSPYGHDSFLKIVDAMAPFVREALDAPAGDADAAQA